MEEIYTIKSLQAGPHKDLTAVVKKHLQTEYQRPINALQRQVFLKVLKYIEAQAKPVIIDAGCGTGLSTLKLAAKFEDHLVVGIDQSIVRLQRNQVFRQGGEQENALLVRANLIDFWRLAVEHQLPVAQQFILYPNPYPKPAGLTKRWHGHPVFPYLLQLGKTIEVRSNWRIYLEEFALAAKQVKQYWGQINVLTAFAEPLTAFEAKYWQHGERTYQLILRGS